MGHIGTEVMHHRNIVGHPVFWCNEHLGIKHILSVLYWGALSDPGGALYRTVLPALVGAAEYYELGASVRGGKDLGREHGRDVNQSQILIHVLSGGTGPDRPLCSGLPG